MISEVTIEEKKKYLRRYKTMINHIQILEKKREILDDKIKSIGSPVISDLPRSTVSITTADKIAQKDELERRIASQMSRAKELRYEILNCIESLDNLKEAEVLELYFIDMFHIVEIADILDISDRQVYRLYSKGVNNIDVSKLHQVSV